MTIQVTKTEKIEEIVKVVQEESYTISGLSRLDMVVLKYLTGRCNGTLTRKIWDKLEVIKTTGLPYNLIDVIELHRAEDYLERAAKSE